MADGVQTMPRDEQILLGSLLMRPQERHFLEKIKPIWLGETGRKIYRLIYENINLDSIEILMKMSCENLPVEIVDVASDEFCVTESLVRDFVHRHKKRELATQLIRLGKELLEGSKDIEEAQKELFEIQSDNDLTDPVASFAEAVDSAWRFYRGVWDGDNDTLPWPGTTLPKKIYDLYGSELIAVAARPSMGKSAFMLHLADSWASWGYPVAFLTLEMKKEDLISRWFTRYVGRSIRGNLKDLTEEERNLLRQKMDEYGLLPVYFMDSGEFSIGRICSSVRNMKARYGIRAVLIDYLQLITGGEGVNRNEKIGDITRTLKLLATELNIPVIMGCQLNRNVENRTDKHPLLGDMRESGNIEQDCDIVLALHRPHTYDMNKPEDELEIGVLKQRNGETGWGTKLRFDTAKQEIGEKGY